MSKIVGWFIILKTVLLEILTTTFFRSIDTAAALCFFPGWHHRLSALLHQVRFRDQGDGDDDHDGGGVDVGAVELSLWVKCCCFQYLDNFSGVEQSTLCSGTGQGRGSHFTRKLIIMTIMTIMTIMNTNEIQNITMAMANTVI